MTADELGPINLPAVPWTTDTGSRGSGAESTDQEKKVKSLPKKTKKTSPEVEFEPVEHELDSIA